MISYNPYDVSQSPEKRIKAFRRYLDEINNRYPKLMFGGIIIVPKNFFGDNHIHCLLTSKPKQNFKRLYEIPAMDLFRIYFEEVNLFCVNDFIEMVVDALKDSNKSTISNLNLSDFSKYHRTTLYRLFMDDAGLNNHSIATLSLDNLNGKGKATLKEYLIDLLMKYEKYRLMNNTLNTLSRRYDLHYNFSKKKKSANDYVFEANIKKTYKSQIIDINNNLLMKKYNFVVSDVYFQPGLLEYSTKQANLNLLDDDKYHIDYYRKNLLRKLKNYP